MKKLLFILAFISCFAQAMTDKNGKPVIITDIEEGNFDALYKYSGPQDGYDGIKSHEKFNEHLKNAFVFIQKEKPHLLKFLKTEEALKTKITEFLSNSSMKKVAKRMVNNEGNSELNDEEKSKGILLLQQVAIYTWTGFVKRRLLVVNFPEGEFDRISEALGLYDGKYATTVRAADKELSELYQKIKKSENPDEFIEKNAMAVEKSAGGRTCVLLNTDCPLVRSQVSWEDYVVMRIGHLYLHPNYHYIVSKESSSNNSNNNNNSPKYDLGTKRLGQESDETTTTDVGDSGTEEITITSSDGTVEIATITHETWEVLEKLSMNAEVD